MKRKLLSPIKAIGLLVLPILASCSPSSSPDWDLIREAYTFAFPLVLLDATKTKMTNTVEATSKQAPVNQFIFANGLANAESTDVVTPNVDTIYSQLFLDLSEGPVMIEKPAVQRFCSIEVIDAYANCVAVLGTGGDDDEAHKYMFTGSSNDKTVPAGYEEVPLLTTSAWLLVRTLSNGESDLVNVKAIQDGFKAYTYAQYEAGTISVPPKGSYKEENNFNPSKHVLSLSPKEYFQKANSLMKDNKPAAHDLPIIERMKNIGVGPSLSFSEDVLGNDYSSHWSNMLNGLAASLSQESEKFYISKSPWRYFGKPIAEFGTEYSYRALIAIGGLGANPVSIAVYPKADTDSKGKELSGENKYIVHFNKGELPPVKEKGFWSITAYNSDNLLIDNALNRYCVNDRSDLEYNEDGSLDIYLENASPSEEKRNNWLPVSSSSFHLFMRIYLPEDAVISNSWPTPSISIAE